jgi:hypothetical protein
MYFEGLRQKDYWVDVWLLKQFQWKIMDRIQHGLISSCKVQGAGTSQFDFGVTTYTFIRKRLKQLYMKQVIAYIIK